MSEKIDFNSKAVMRQIKPLIKVPIHRDTAIIGIYAPNTRAVKHMQQILTG